MKRALMLVLLCLGCSGPAPLTVEMPLHLEEHFGAASVTGSEAPADLPKPVEWRFDQPQPAWTSARLSPSSTPGQRRIDDALRLSLTAANRQVRDRDSSVGAAIYVDVPDWKREDWAYVVVRARTSDEVDGLGVGFNLKERSDTVKGWPFRYGGEDGRVVHDGSVQTYLLRADWSGGQWGEDPWRKLGLWFHAKKPASIDLLSVSVIPKEASYAAAPVGVRAEVRGRVYRPTLYVHAPARLEYRIRVPDAGRLDLGLGVLRGDAPVTFRIAVAPQGAKAESLLTETYADKEHWAQRTVDLSHLAGRTVTLTLQADAERPGTVALWGAPTLTGHVTAKRPNVIFYVIDGGGADFMSVYGYNRRTTPNLERLAAEGAVFEHAYSNAGWTKPSTASFMTSLQNSVMGGYRNWNDPVPDQVLTMAEHLHRTRYQTGVFLANPNAGTLSNLQRGVDWMQEGWTEFTYFGGEHHKESSRFLQEAFWKWREAYPGAPYWVHFQSTDVHGDFPAVTPFAGLFVGPEEQKTWKEWDKRLRKEGHRGIYSEAYKTAGISRVAYQTLQQGLYDETMAHTDYQIGRLVERLKAQGEWGNTLLVIGADHSTRAAMEDMGIAIQDSLPPEWAHESGPMFRPTVAHVPLIVVWPGHIQGGQRFREPVSMIDVLPTVLDLLDLPAPEVAMGQSLAPLLRGQPGWEPRPVILDEFEVDLQTGKLRGLIEVIDGRWGASLEINADPEKKPKRRRPVPLLLYDLWNDPMCLRSVHQERPDLVEKYTKFLEAQWAAHQALAQRFSRSGNVALTPEQLGRLRALGYIR